MQNATTAPNSGAKTIQQIKKEKETKVSELMKSCSLFWAFSNEQFAANKTPLQEGEKYVHIGAGGYLPKGQVDNFLNGMEAINKAYKAEVNANKQTRIDNISYELHNHEAFYTGTIEDTLEALGGDYKPAEVWKVFRAEQAKQQLQS